MEFTEKNLETTDFSLEHVPYQEEDWHQWFDQIIDEYNFEQPVRGQFLQGEIQRIEDDIIFVDVGQKRTAIVPNRDLNLLDDELLKSLSEGDQVVVYVLRQPEGDQDLLVSLNKGIEQAHWNEMQEYLEKEDVFPIEISGYNRGGLIANYKSLQGFIPFSHVPSLRRVGDQAQADNIKQDLVGCELTVKVIEIDRERNRLIFSVRDAQQARRRRRLMELEAGQILRGPITSIVKFGVFVDLDGIDGLVHISKLDWNRVNHPADIFKVGDEIEVRVIDVDLERERISLDRRILLPSPWSSFKEKYDSGQTLEGKVTTVVDFGAFVEVADGVEGLVHVSELGYTSSDNPQEVIRPGEAVLVRILDIDEERERISLSMRQVPLESQISWSLENTEAA